VSDSPTIFEALREGHDVQRTPIDLFVETTGDSEGRRELFTRVRRELAAHAGAEERYFYVPLVLSPTEKRSLAADYQSDMARRRSEFD
jgi:hypothetical protein